MPSFNEALRAIRFTGLSNTLSAVRYARYKHRLDRLYIEKKGMVQVRRRPGGLQAARAAQSGGYFRFENASLEIVFLAQDLIRVAWEPGIPPVPYAIEKTEWPAVDTELKEEPDCWLIRSEGLQARVYLDGAIQILDREGCRLRYELPPERVGSEPDLGSWVGRAALRPEECLYGLGEQAGRLNLRGGLHRMWNTDPGGTYGPGKDPVYTPLPVYLGLHHEGSYLVFYENPSRATFNLGGSLIADEEWETAIDRAGERSDICLASFDAGMLRYYIASGPPDQAIERFTELTGRPPLPPQWSLGYHQCRWGYKTEQDIRQVVAGFKAHNMPLSAIHLDIDYMHGFRVFTIDPQCFPNLAGLAEDLAAEGIRLVTIIDPGVKVDEGYYLFRQGIQEGRFCSLPNGRPMVGLVWPGRSVFPDFTDPETRAWWGEQYARLVDMGVAGFWHDMNEPASFSSGEDMTLPLATCHCMDGRGGDHVEAHNLYGLLMNRAGFEALERLAPERRPWMISRSGWVGMQRYAWNWTGDTESTWEGLRMTVATILGLGLSGIPYSGPDIGGFTGNPSAELHIRWFQLAAFLPFFRTHSAIGTARREPWVFGEPYTPIARQFLQLRCRLIPYLYTLAWEASQHGHPLVRPLFWGDLHDRNLWEIEDAFYLGEALLVAPVTQPGAMTREIRLPAGRWYSFWDGAVYTGPEVIQMPVCLEQIPVMARGGSILPMVDNGALILNVYFPHETGEWVNRIYTDAGDGPVHSLKDWRLDKIHFRWDGENAELEWLSEGQYPFPYTAIELRLYGFRFNGVEVGGQVVQVQSEYCLTSPFRHIRFIS